MSALLAAALLLASVPADRHIVLTHDRAQMTALEVGTGRRDFQIIPAFAAELSAADVTALRADPRVRAVVRDACVRLGSIQEDAPWQLDRLDQADGTDGSYNVSGTGSGVHVYIVDSGIRRTHVEFEGRVDPGVSMLQEDASTDDCNGHGTHVAGSVGSATFGVAKGVTLVPVRVFGCDSSTWSSTILSGLDWIAANGTAPGVVNASLIGEASALLDEGFAALVALGFTVVVAAGNDSADACEYSPARVPDLITVGAVDEDDDQANFSNHGPCLDLYAPGVGIRSTWHTSDTARANNEGTSMASPHVAGVAALLLEEFPDATPAEIRDRLIALATPTVDGNAPDSTNALLQTPPVPENPSQERPTSTACSVSSSVPSSPAGVAITGLLLLAIVRIGSMRRSCAMHS